MTDLSQFPKDHPIHKLDKTVNEQRDQSLGVPKMTFEQRCAVLACHRHGVPSKVIAHAFHLHRRTVAHIYSTASPHYHSVRAEEQKLGPTEFIFRYMTEDVAASIATSYQAVNELSKSRADQVRVDTDAPRRNRNKDEGDHVVTNEWTTKPHSVRVFWSEEKAAWGWLDLEESEPFHTFVDNDGEKFKTSTAALVDAQKSVEG